MGFSFYCRVRYNFYACVKHILFMTVVNLIVGRCIQSITNFDSFVSLLSL